VAVDDCGFLRYSLAYPDDVRLAWYAWQPGEFAIYSFDMVRGVEPLRWLPTLPPVKLPIEDRVGSTDHNGDGVGNFWEEPPTDDLLDGCTEAAYAISLRVYAKATNGNGYRLTQYDASDIRAMAIAPR
jgi:hypothetical protein